MNRRNISFLVLAAASGAAATYAIVASRGIHSGNGPTTILDEAGRDLPSSIRARLPALDRTEPPGVEDAMQTYQLAASATLVELDALLREAASISTPSGRLLLHALLTRYAELDIHAALRAVRGLDVERALLVSFYTEWMRAETDAVLAALRDMEDRGDARSVATALLHTIGEDERIARRVLAALPEADRTWVRADAILASVSADPAAALEDALAFEPEDVGFRLVQQVGILGGSGSGRGVLGFGFGP